MITYVGIAAFIVLDVIGALAVVGLVRRQGRREARPWPIEAGPDDVTRWIRQEPVRRPAAVIPDEPTLAIMARPMYPGSDR